MSEARIKIRIGEHEFEAEGPSDLVQEQFSTFKELIAQLGGKPNMPANHASEKATQESGAINTSNESGIPLEKIMQVKGRLIWLTVNAESVADAVMVMLLGHRVLRSSDSVTGGEIMD